MRKLKKLTSGLAAVVLTATLLAALSGATVKASGFTTIVSGSGGYVGACKRLIDTAGYGQFWAVDTIVIANSGTNNHARANVSAYNAGGYVYHVAPYHSTNGSWSGGTVYASGSLGENISIWANQNSGAAGSTNTVWLWQLGLC